MHSTCSLRYRHVPNIKIDACIIHLSQIERILGKCINNQRYETLHGALWIAPKRWEITVVGKSSLSVNIVILTHLIGSQHSYKIMSSLTVKDRLLMFAPYTDTWSFGPIYRKTMNMFASFLGDEGRIITSWHLRLTPISSHGPSCSHEYRRLHVVLFRTVYASAHLLSCLAVPFD